MRTFFLRSLLLLFLVLPSVGNSQSFNAYKKAGDEAFLGKDYNAAMYYYARALDKNGKDPYLCYRYALSAQSFSAFEVAEDYLLKTLKADKENAFPEAVYHLGMVYKNLGQYEQAIQQFNRFITENPQGGLLKKAKEEVSACGSAMALLEEPRQIEIVHLGKSINTAYSEFGALKRGDTLYYSSYRFDNKKDKTIPSRKISKTLISVKNGQGRLLKKFNEEEANTAHVTFSLDGNRIYYNVCTYGIGLDIKCTLFYKEKDGRGRWKKTGIALPDTVNLKNYTSTQPTIGFDSVEQTEVLFFASDRPGGAGAMDIWKVSVGKENRKFGDPVPVEDVNTPDNEITPFFDEERQVLYFSSDRVQSMGGYDVFSWKMNQGDAVVEQLFPPVNSSYNDIYYVLNVEGETGYFSSNRPGTYYLDKSNKACCNDIYYFRPVPPEVKMDSFLVNDKPLTPLPLPTQEPAFGKEPETLEDFLPLALFFDNDEPDKRTRRTTTRKNYDETFQKYYPKKELFGDSFAGPLEEDQKEEALFLVEDFFENEVEKGHRYLMLFSEILLKRLEKGEEVEIFIKGFTSPRAQSDYNLSLGKRRVSCLKNHFFDYKNQIFKPYIDTGKLRITERSFGETSAALNVSDALEDLRNSVFSPAASRERRVEIVEIKIGEE